jgi:hypothetical protein
MDDLEETRPAAADRYDVIVPLWGAKYVDMFVNYCLPSQLAPGNLPSLPRHRCSYHIYTHQEDAKAIWNAASVRKLRKLLDVSLVTFRDEDVLRDAGLSDYRYVKNLQKMTWCYQRAMHACRGVDTAFVFMTPDSVWASGAFRYMDECQRAGVRALMGLGLITHREKLQHDLAPFAAAGDGTVIDVPSRKLVSLALDSLHPLAIARVMKNGGSRFFSAYYWLKAGQGFVARCFYLHPIMVRPRVHVERIPSTVDYRYVPRAVPNPDEVHVITDSDNLFYLDMADLHHEAVALSMENYTRPEILDWMCEWTDAYHRKYFGHSIIVHENDVKDEFEEELATAERFADSLLVDFADHQPVAGRKLYPSNVYFGDALNALHAPHAKAAPHGSHGGGGRERPEPVDPMGLALSLARRTASAIRSLPRRAVRKCYRLLLGKLYARLNQLEATIALYRSHSIMTEHKVREFDKYLRTFEQRLEVPRPDRAEANPTPYLICTEFQLRREIERLRLDLDRHLNERQNLRLLGNSDVPRAIG